MDQTAPAEPGPAMSLRKILVRAAMACGLVVMLMWSVVLPVLGILYVAEHFFWVAAAAS
ncbi:MAG TPA: hypothetical protein VG757_13485 [Devosia sp.]|nr:hypothetical protein [Devosia sp.]